MFFPLFSFFSFKEKLNMLGFLTLPMVKGGITRDAFTQKVAATGKKHSNHLAEGTVNIATGSSEP